MHTNWTPVAARKRRITGLLICPILFHCGLLSAEPVAVRFPEGSVHGFLVIRTLDRKILASGDLTQTIHGDRLKSHLIFHFKDGSVDDETAAFTQRGEFRLISDHHIQKGPSFKNPTDVMIDVASGRVTVRYEEKGQQKIETEQMKLPPDLANGIILNLLKNVRADVKETKVSYIVASPKPRLVGLSIAPAGGGAFSVAGAHHKAVRFIVQVEMGGISGMIAPLIGKQPADTHVWIVTGDAPAFIKSQGPLYLGGPIWLTELALPIWEQS